MHKFSKLIFCVFMVLGGCGYHLRGAYDVPNSIRNVYIEGGSATLRAEFSALLKSSSGQLVESPDKADLVVRIFQDDIQRRVLSLSERGRSNDIELAGHLEFEIYNAKRQVLVPREPIDFRKEYFNDQQDVMAKDNEESVIRREMYQQVVRNIVNRGRAALEVKGK